MAIPPGFPPFFVEQTVIGSGFPERTDPAALVIGPTGVAFDEICGTLYVADTLDDRIAAIPNALFRSGSAGTGRTVTKGGWLNGPLGLTLAPDRHLLSANGDDGNIVETDLFIDDQVAIKLADDTPPAPLGAGALFGLTASNDGVYFVDDANELEVLQ